MGKDLKKNVDKIKEFLKSDLVFKYFIGREKERLEKAFVNMKDDLFELKKGNSVNVDKEEQKIISRSLDILLSVVVREKLDDLFKSFIKYYLNLVYNWSNNLNIQDVKRKIDKINRVLERHYNLSSAVFAMNKLYQYGKDLKKRKNPGVQVSLSFLNSVENGKKLL